MGRGWQAFLTGWLRAGRYWRALLLLFGLNLLAALLLTLFPASALATGLGHRPALAATVDGLEPWLVMEALLSPRIEAALGAAGADTGPPASLLPAMQAGLLALAAAPLLAWLMGAFLTGGVLLTYAESPRPLGWRRFGYGCWRWFGVFLLLGLFQAVLLVVGLLVGVIVAGLAAAAAGPWLLWPVLVGLAGGLLAGWAALDFTRIFAVTGDTRNLARTFIRAARFLFSRPLALAGLYLPVLLLLGLLPLLYGRGLAPYLPPGLWPLTLAVQQLFILAALWTRLARLAGGVALAAAVDSSEAALGNSQTAKPLP